MTQRAYETIRYAVVDDIATITLHRAEQLNAFNSAMLAELLEVIDRIDADDAVRAVIVTGEGRAFCAGADLSDGPAAFDLAHSEDFGEADATPDVARDGGGRLTLRLFRCLKPMIAAINGPAVGVGITMTLAMDIRLASDIARIGFVFARRGIVPEAASAFFLPRIVGIAQALRWCLGGAVFDAVEAQAAGLVSEMLPPAELLPRARAIAREIADNTAPVAIALTRRMLWEGTGMAHPMEAHRIDSRGIAARGKSADGAEGVAAFLEKRPAVFREKVSADMPGFYPWREEPGFA